MSDLTPTQDPLDATVAALAAAYPRLRRADPMVPAAPLAEVRLTPSGTARYRWSGYDIHVTAGHEDHLDRDPDSTILHRQIRAHATLLVPQPLGAEGIGHVEWEMTNPRPQLVFPAALAVATADKGDPRFAAAVLSTVAQALTYARLATAHAAAHIPGTPGAGTRA
ncbi:hypothetical protein ACFVAM_21230 [Streptomyces californicus]|uniref:hypothetical protein n=1 Tax=Streptomyces TaxID=1883 RepID=UPI00088DF189|nr:hypothetical protein [Streptomyces sp. LaPpAH-199]MYW80325.1 hypothetical protein [Streptomyces sp. SID8369]SDE31371.1 hypothetical protein F610DRAFT_06797 [Streptomyces sp. LaPpAH-199]